MNFNSRCMVVLCLVAALSGLSQAETTKTSSSSKSGTTSKAKAKAKAKPASSEEDSDAPRAVKPKAKVTPSEDDADEPKTAKPKPKATSPDDESDDSAKTKAKAQTKASEDDDIDEPRKKEAPRPAAVTSINVDELAGFDNYPKQVRSLVESAVALTHLGLTYTYGSSEPNQGGMDCSGTMYHVLRFQGLKDVPRQSDEMCAWVRDRTRLHLTPTATEFGDVEFAALRPGDLLFWTGTAQTSRKLPVTHVMLYLGKLKSSGKRVVFGSSDGRSYEGNRRCGVSVFDFSLPKPGGKAAFYGYGPAPGLATPEALALEEIRKAEVPVVAAKPPLVDGEKMFASKNAAVPEPLPQGDTKPAGSAASPPMQESESVASKKTVTDDEPKAAASGTKAQSSVAAVRKGPASGFESPAQREDGVPRTAMTRKNTGDGSGSKPAAGSVAKTSSTLPSSSQTVPRESSEAKKTASDTGGETSTKATPAKPKTSVASSGSKTSSSASGATRRESGTSKKSTASTTALRPVARKKAPPEKPESKPEKVVREVVDTIRNAFK